MQDVFKSEPEYDAKASWLAARIELTVFQRNSFAAEQLRKLNCYAPSLSVADSVAFRRNHN